MNRVEKILSKDKKSLYHLMSAKLYKPNIFICGPTGSGKSSSLRNLEPEQTIIISTEQEPLPFDNASEFKKQVQVSNFKRFQKTFDKALKSDAEIIVVDSFTSLAEFVYKHAVEIGEDGFDLWGAYKQLLHDTLIKAKTVDKYVVFMGIDDVTLDIEQRVIRTVSVQGSLKGKVSKEFVIVLWTKVLPPDIKTDSDKPRYVFVTNSDGTNQAKSPMKMFKNLHIDNDLNAVIQRTKTYYKQDK